MVVMVVMVVAAGEWDAFGGMRPLCSDDGSEALLLLMIKVKTWREEVAKCFPGGRLTRREA